MKHKFATETLSEIPTGELCRSSGPDPQWLWSKSDADARHQIGACLRDWIAQGIAPRGG